MYTPYIPLPVAGDQAQSVFWVLSGRSVTEGMDTASMLLAGHGDRAAPKHVYTDLFITMLLSVGTVPWDILFFSSPTTDGSGGL